MPFENIDQIKNVIAQEINQALGKTGKDGAANTAAEGVIQNQGLLDLSGVQSAEDLSHIKELKSVGMVLIAEELEGELLKRPMTDVGAVIPVPRGAAVRSFAGQTKLAGDTFAGEASADNIVMIAGQVIFTSPVTEINVGQLIVAGQLIAPESSQAAIGGAISKLAGQTLYYPETGKPRIVIGHEDFEEAYFQYLNEKVVLVIVGEASFADDVQPQTLQDKLGGMVVVGSVSCSAALKPCVQAICSECVGEIKARDDG